MPQQQTHQPLIANDLVIEETSLELAIPKHLVKEVVSAQAEFTIDRIREGGFEGVSLPGLGKIKVKVSKLEFITNLIGSENIRKNTQVNREVPNDRSAFMENHNINDQ